MLWIGTAVTLVASIVALMVVILVRAWFAAGDVDFVLLGTFRPPADTPST
jgi:hypothetical protein